MKYIIDRFESNCAVCENENQQTVNIPIKELPANLKEGDCLSYDNGVYTIDSDSTEERKKRIRNKINNLFKDNG